MCKAAGVRDPIHDEFGIVVGADVERGMAVDGRDPVPHFRVIPDDFHGAQGQGPTVRDTL